MATIDALPSGKYRARIRRQGLPTLSKTFTSKDNASTWARRVESAQERGLAYGTTESASMTLAEALDKYASDVTPKHRGAVNELSMLRALRAERLTTRPLASISQPEIEAMRDRWVSTGYNDNSGKHHDYATATINRRLALLHAVYSQAAGKWGLLGLHNPVVQVHLKGANERDRRLEPRELDAICTATASPYLPAILRLAVETAMRRGEWVKLTWAMVNLERRTIELPGVHDGKRGVTKNGRDRGVPLSRKAVELLSRIPHTDNRLFPITGPAVSRAFARAVRRARREYVIKCDADGKVPEPQFLVGLHFHDSRHEAATRLADKLNVPQWMKVVGHADIKTALRYFNPKTEDLARLLDRRGRNRPDNT